MEGASGKEVLERLKMAASASNDSELSKKLGLSKQSIAAARKNGKVPEGWIPKAAEIFHVSMDWLRWGLGSMKLPVPLADVQEIADTFQVAGGKALVSPVAEAFAPLAALTDPFKDIPSHQASSLNSDYQHIPANREEEASIPSSGNADSQHELYRILERRLETLEEEWKELLSENRQLYRDKAELLRENGELLRENGTLREKLARLEAEQGKRRSIQEDDEENLPSPFDEQRTIRSSSRVGANIHK